MPNLFQESSDNVSFPTAKECAELQVAHARRFLKTCDGLEEALRNNASLGGFSCWCAIPDGVSKAWMDKVERMLKVLGYKVSVVHPINSDEESGLIITWNHL